MAKKNKTKGISLGGIGLLGTISLVLACVASVNAVPAQVAFADAAPEDPTPQQVQELTKAEESEFLNGSVVESYKEAVAEVEDETKETDEDNGDETEEKDETTNSTTSNRFDSIKNSQSENSEIPNEVELEKGDIAENLTPEIQDMVNEGNKNLNEDKTGTILNPDQTNPEVNPNNPNGGTIDDATNNLPDSKELKNDQVTNEWIKRGLIGGGILALISLIGAVIGISVACGARKNTSKARNELTKL